MCAVTKVADASELVTATFNYNNNNNNNNNLLVFPYKDGIT